MHQPIKLTVPLHLFKGSHDAKPAPFQSHDAVRHGSYAAASAEHQQLVPPGGAAAAATTAGSLTTAGWDGGRFRPDTAALPLTDLHHNSTARQHSKLYHHPSHPYDPRHACHTGLGELWHRPSVAVSSLAVITFMHLADTFIQSDLVKSGYTFFILFLSVCVPWELNPQPFALLTQCSAITSQSCQKHCWLTFG